VFATLFSLWYRFGLQLLSWAVHLCFSPWWNFPSGSSLWKWTSCPEWAPPQLLCKELLCTILEACRKQTVKWWVLLWSINFKDLFEVMELVQFTPRTEIYFTKLAEHWIAVLLVGLYCDKLALPSDFVSQHRMSTKQMLQREFCRVIEICSSVNTHKHLCTEAHHECTIYSMGLVALECPVSCSQTFIFPHLIFRPVFCCFSEWKLN